MFNENFRYFDDILVLFSMVFYFSYLTIEGFVKF